MKKRYFFTAMFCVLALCSTSQAQQVRVIKVDGWPGTGDIETFNNKLIDAIDADSTARKSNPNVIYELNRGQVYPLGKVIRNYDYHLHIRAAGGTGPKPIIMPGKMANGNYGSKYIQSYNHITLENLELSGHTPTGSVLNRFFEAWGKKSRVVIRGCDMDGDRGAFIAVNGDSMKVYIHDSKFLNTGHRITSGGNGRTIDFRPTALIVDTLVVVNSTHTNQSDRLIRNMGSVVNYLKWDHNTSANNVGFHGALQLGYVRTAIVTNNIFANSISLGHYQSRTQEQTQPEKHFSVISLDTVFSGQRIVVRNNNIYNSKSLVDVWNKYDSVSAPWAITPTIEIAIGQPNLASAHFAEELSFKTSCSPFSAYVDAFFTNPKATAFPENWCVGGDGGFYPDEVDLSYGTSVTSYTRADGGFPLGDLNYYPDKRAAWANWISTSINETQSVTEQIYLYPNPTSSILNISSFADRVVIYSATGSMLKDVHNVNLIRVDDLNPGLYLVNLFTSNGVVNHKVLISR
jgi:hypothetical protein